MASLDAQIKRLSKKLNKIAEIEVKRASSRALNSVIAKEKTRVIRGIAKSTKIQSKIIRKYTHTRKSTAKTQEARLRVYTRAVPVVSLLKASVLLTNRTRGTNRRGVRAAGTQFDGAFINIPKRGGRFKVFKRRGKERNPIEEVKIPIQKEAESQVSKGEKALMDSYKETFKKDLEFRLQKYKV